jgi:hypothetical protein
MSAKAAITEANLRIVREAIAGAQHGVVSMPGNVTITVAEAVAYRDGLQAQLDYLREMADVRREMGLR